MVPKVQLLGRESVQDSHGVEVTSAAWRTAKTHDLLRVLALTPERSASTDWLLDLFWPDADAEHGSSSLRTAACQIRKVLGNDSVARDGHGLTLHAWTDVDAYRQHAVRIDNAITGGSPAQVVRLVQESEQLYGGDLELGGTECRVLHEASRDLRTLRARLLTEGAEAASRCGDWRLSLGLAEQAAAIEPSDQATRALMRAWFAVGETAKPVEEFERLRQHLADEYGVDPAPQTRALYLEVVSACDEWPVREAPIGRENEVGDAVRAVVAWLMDPTGPTGVVWLVGHPGSGRRSVAREAARTIMDPLAGETAEPGEGATVELLRDQGTLTKGLAAMIRLRAETRGRIMLVPISEVDEGVLGEADAVVRLGPLPRTSFRSVLRTVLQARPTERLADELYDEAGGLPGLGCRAARRRLDAGTLEWTPTGVDSCRPVERRGRVLPTLATFPFLLVGLFGIPCAEGEEHRATTTSESRERHLVVAAA